VANPKNAEKGRDIAARAMRLMPYEWELYPQDNQLYGSIPHSRMIEIIQDADGFLHPSKIGEAPSCWVDAKYTVSLIEAGMSGCIIFWHDVMKHGNSMETVFEISQNPIEIAARIQEVVGSIDLEKHSQRTAEEFRNKHSIENTVKKKMDVITRFI
jgi:glycosyltransferase involved in cell wall biosynthesis